MIEKIRRQLICKYTTLFTFVLLLCFGVSYTAYRYNTVNFVYDGLADYLSEELWEAREYLSKYDKTPTVNKINADINSLHNFAYWFADGRLVHGEEPKDEEIATALLERMSSKVYSDNRIYYENIKRHKQKWYFVLLKQSFSLHNGQKGDVFVLANYTPVRKNTKTYIKIAVAALVLLSFLAFLIGSWFASRSMEHIEKMYQKQKQFVSDAAHELRIPLSILLSSAELLEYRPNDRKLTDGIKEQILQMNELLNNLLAIARYDGSSVSLQKEFFDLKTLAEEAVTAFSLRGVAEIGIVCPDTAVINADKGMIRQLLYILLDNAVKYTDENKKISIGIRQDENETRFCVEDNGIGIKEQDIEYIFERFWRADKSRNTEGLGLGLSLAGMIVKFHQGQIKVKSKFGSGSVFEVILPGGKS